MKHQNLSIAGIIAASTLATSSAWAGGQGPSRDYFLTDGFTQTIYKFRGQTVDSATAGFSDEVPIAVTGTIRTSGFFNGAMGTEYGLDLTDLGKDFTLGAPNGTQFFDGTTDGQFLYAIEFQTGDVYRFKKNWKQGVLHFALSGGPGAYVGITYDPSNDSFWVSRWDDDAVENYSRSGNLLDSFEAGHDRITSLALDHRTGTLWMGNDADPGVYQGFDRDGNVVDTIDYGLTDPTGGGEFDLGAVAAIRSFDVTRGEHIEGGKATLKIVDGDRMQIDSEQLPNGSERMDLVVRLKRDVVESDSLDIMVESKISESGGQSQLFARNWNTGNFDLVDEHAISTHIKYQSAVNLVATKYVRADGIVEVRIRHDVPMPLGGTVRSQIDLVQVVVRGG